MARSPREPRPLAGAVFHPGAGFHSYPPARRRFTTARKVCGHCGLPADTAKPDCPVCGARYPRSPRHPWAILITRGVSQIAQRWRRG